MYVLYMGLSVLLLEQKIKLSNYTPWWRFGERRYSSYSVLTSALDGVELSASLPGRSLPPEKELPSTHWIGHWVDHRAGLDAQARSLFSPARDRNPVIQSIVSYPSSSALE
jgi:hypothetical protein